MLLTKELKDEITMLAQFLKYVDDGFGVKITDNKRIFIQVVDYRDRKEYFIELNDIDKDNSFEPCASHNIFSEFGNIEMLIKSIEDYLK